MYIADFRVKTCVNVFRNALASQTKQIATHLSNFYRLKSCGCTGFIQHLVYRLSLTVQILLHIMVGLNMQSKSKCCQCRLSLIKPAWCTSMLLFRASCQGLITFLYKFISSVQVMAYMYMFSLNVNKNLTNDSYGSVGPRKFWETSWSGSQTFFR